MSATTATLSGMSDNIAGFLNASEKHQRKIDNIRIKKREENLFSSRSSLSSEDEIRSNQSNQALERGSLKSKKRKKGTCYVDNPSSCAHVCAVRTFWLRPRSTVVSQVACNVLETTSETDSHDDTTCLGGGVLKLYDYNCLVNVQGYDPSIGANQ